MTRQEFKDAATAQAFTVTDPEMSDYGRTLIHSFAGFLGADWDLVEVLAGIDAASEVHWERDSWIRHQLAIVEPGGRRVCFDVKAPGGGA